MATPPIDEAFDTVPQHADDSDTPAVATMSVPDARGRFGEFGGRYVPETLIAALDQLAEVYQAAAADER
ncbi:MAG: hypothetical protein KDB18_10415, partial [Salinibacterium sp.]|nr:hypothetical protein [Salinibacterium sp.]